VIEQIHIRGLGVIEDATLEPHPGFTAVTGETGAGKTMVLTGLGLLLGDKADPGSVRAGDTRADVEGRFTVDPASDVAARVHDAGGDLDDASLLVARTVSVEGRSRAYVGARSVPASLLTELAESLVAVHGQSDQQRLLHPAAQRTALDRYAEADVAGPYAAYREAWERLRTLEAELTDVSTHLRERAQQAEVLRLGLSDIEAADPLPGEDDQLRAEADRLRHSGALKDAAATAHTALSGSEDGGRVAPDALSLLVSARRALDAQREHDPSLAALQERVAELCALIADVSADLGSYLAGAEADPLRLSTVEERRAVLGALTRKYGDTVDDVLAWAEQAAGRLGGLEDDEARVAALTAARDAARADLEHHGAALTKARTEGAGRFGAAVTAELTDLAMPHAQVLLDVRALTAPGPYGCDEAEMLLAPRPGAPARPLARAASGGELSRVMLAVEVVLAGSDPVPTMVFDEVDAGVGGKAAVEVGRRLARLARTTQVLVVTHLPQVAAFADRQVVVEKSDDGSVTTAGLRVVEGAGRVRELARMMAGLESSETAAAHAEELLELAEKDRVPRARRRGKARP
jgi:DNA repair protein RecN (Recombination protein N)